MQHRTILKIVILVFLLTPLQVRSAEPAWNEWIEPSFPFFSSVVDRRSGPIKNNLTPRAIVFPLGADCYLAYDVDLLRVAAVWKAGDAPFLGAGMAVNSYPYQGNKVPGGDKDAPKPHGTILFENGVYAGVGVGQPQWNDPRPNLPPAVRVVNGGLDPKVARFLGVQLAPSAAIEYEVADAVHITERFTLEKAGVVRQLTIGKHQQPLYIAVAKQTKMDGFACQGPASLEVAEGHVVCLVRPSDQEQSVSISFSAKNVPEHASVDTPQGKRWEEVVNVSLPPIAGDRALNVEPIPLPLDNRYGRAVRAAAIDFFPDGRAALVTYDGDVWMADGLQPDSKDVAWTRFTSGLHEPLSIAIRDEEIFVFDRNGLWCLHDRDNNGEADYHELFCSRIDQTAETREFASAMRIAKDGGFILCKPGQQKTFSSVLKISPDGKHAHVVAHGFRQPFMGYDPTSGRIAVSDQQGNWVPSTPVHFIEEGGFYGFPNGPTDEQRPVTPPLTWIPHQVCSSSTSIVWTRDAKLGPLNEAAILLSYHQPKLLQIHADATDAATQGGATELDLQLDAPLLHGAMNPADGLLYITGFKIWGTGAKEITYLARLRHNPRNTWTTPVGLRIAKRGVLLQFATPLDPESLNRPASFAVRRWNYQRTSKYGSGYFQLDGKPGTETLPTASAKLSTDGRTVFLGVPNMREAMQIEVSYDIGASNGEAIQHQTFLTAHALPALNLSRLGFADNQVDMTVKHPSLADQPTITPTAERGLRYYTKLGCVGCHSVDGTTEGKNGPSWLDLYGAQRKLVKTGKLVQADEAYLRESIFDPTAKVAEGAINGEAGMPIYSGVLNTEQVDSLLLYIKALADKSAREKLARLNAASNAIVRKWKVDDFRTELAHPLRGRSLANGKLAFLSASCFNCHQVGQGKGGRLGPDLAKLDPKIHGLELLTHILEPSRRIEEKFKARTIATVDGKVHKGFVIFENETELRLMADPLSRQAPVVVLKDQIEEMVLSNVSAMPEGIVDRLQLQEILDLLAYIESKGDPKHSAYKPK